MAQDRTFGAPDDVADEYQAPQAPEYQGTVVDDDGDDLLSQLAADARKELDQEARLVVRERPGWVLGFSTLIGQHELQTWERRSTPRKGKNGKADVVRQAGYMLLEKSTAIYRERQDGTLAQVLDEDGDPVTLTSYAFLDLYQDLRRDSLAVLRRFCGDSGVLALGGKLVDLAGWGDTAAEVEDPTRD